MITFYFDLDSRKVFSNKTGTPVGEIPLKLRDQVPVTIFFIRKGTQRQLVGTPTIVLGLKGVLTDEDFVAVCNSWTFDEDSRAYSGTLDLTTSELEALFDDEQQFVDVFGEILVEDDSGTLRSGTLDVRVDFQVINGDEGSPTLLPDADDFVADRAVLYDRAQALSTPQKTQARANIAAGDAVVSGTLDQFADVTQTGGATLTIGASTTLSGGTHSGVNTGDQSSVTGNAGTVTTINGRISAGTNITLSGSGTAASPYVINSSGGVGGASAYTDLTDAASVDLPAVNGPLGDALDTLDAHAASTSNPHSVTKTQVGLGNVDNTSDSGKPVSTAQQTALDLKADLAGASFTGAVGMDQSLDVAGNASFLAEANFNDTTTFNGSLFFDNTTLTFGTGVAAAFRTGLGTGSLAGTNAWTGQQEFADTSTWIYTVAAAGNHRSSLGLIIGTDVQAYDAALSALAAGSDFVQFTGPTTSTKVFTLPNASSTLLYSGGPLGTPSSGTLTNCTFPTLNQNTTGSAATLTTPRTIQGASFDGSANVTTFPTLTLSGQSLTGSQATTLADLSATWNTSGNPIALKIAATNTASGATTKFASFLAGASGTTEVFSVSKAGNLYAAGTLQVDANVTLSGTQVSAPSLYHTTTARFTLPTASVFGWTSGSNASGSNTTTISQNAAGVAQIGTTTNNALGSLLLTNLTASGLISTTPQALSGAGAVDVVTSATAYTSTGVAQALTLANGTVNGQLKTVVHVSRGSGTGTGILTPTTANGFTTITFTGTGAAATLQYFTTGGWVVLGSNANAAVA